MEKSKANELYYQLKGLQKEDPEGLKNIYNLLSALVKEKALQPNS